MNWKVMKTTADPFLAGLTVWLVLDAIAFIVMVTPGQPFPVVGMALATFGALLIAMGAAAYAGKSQGSAENLSETMRTED